MISELATLSASSTKTRDLTNESHAIRLHSFLSDLLAVGQEAGGTLGRRLNAQHKRSLLERNDRIVDAHDFSCGTWADSFGTLSRLVSRVRVEPTTY